MKKKEKNKYFGTESPVLLITFNRPEKTRKVFEKIKLAKVKKLYIANDGPRKGNLDDIKAREEIKKLADEVDWNCELYTKFHEKNLGCKLGVSTAISWALENEDRVIIIEDDCVPSLPFFKYCNYCLEKYKDDERIAMISGNNYTPIKEISSDYFFTKYGHIWGWATWKRVWDKFDVNLPFLENDITSGFDKINYLTKDEFKYFKKRWKHLFEKINNDTINTWDYQFSYFRMINNLISIAPRVNLVSNIGLFSSRTGNTSKNNDNYVPADSDFILLKHPAEIRISLEYEKYHFKKIINKKSPLSQRVYRKIIRIIKG